MSYRNQKTPIGVPPRLYGVPHWYGLDATLNISYLSSLQPIRPNPRPNRINLPIRYAIVLYPGAQPAVQNPKPRLNILPWSFVTGYNK